MQDREPTVRSRELGEGLRQAMELAGYNGTTIAHRLGWSQGHVSRLLSGKRGGSSVDVSAFLAVCAIIGAERERLMALTPQHSEPGWFMRHGARLPAQLITLINHENRAVTINQFESTLVPGLLQTAAYARAVIEGVGTVPREEIEDRVAARLARQGLFDRFTPPVCRFFIHEFALRLAVGGREVMSDQLHHLLQMSVRPNLVLRVVPASAGVHSAINGSFQLMEFVEIHPIAYLETETASVFLELPIETEAYRDIVSKLGDTALDEGQSRELIAAVATELYGERHNDLAQEQLQRERRGLR